MDTTEVPETQQQYPRPPRRRRWPSRLILAAGFVVTLLIGVGIGAATQNTGISQAAYNASQARVSSLRSQVSSLGSQVSALQTNVSNISNGNFDGPETVSLSGVYAFQINGPCTWVLVP